MKQGVKETDGELHALEEWPEREKARALSEGADNVPHYEVSIETSTSARNLSW